MSLPLLQQHPPGPGFHTGGAGPMRQDGMNCVSLNSTLQAQPVLSSSQLRSPQLGVDPLVALIMSDKNFSTAVSAQHLHLAAAAAVNVFKVHGAAALERSRLALSGLDTSTVPASTSGEYSEHRKGYDSRELRVNDRVFVHGSNKRTPQEVVGRAAVVVSLHGNGWVLVQLVDTGEHMRIQQRYLSHAEPGMLPAQQQAPRSSQALPSMLNTAPTALDMDSFPDLPDNLDGIVDGLGHGDLLLPDGSPRAGNGMGFSMQMPTAQMLQQHSYGAAHHIPDSYNGMSMAGVRQQGAVPGRAASQAGASTPKVLLKPKDVLHTVRAEMTHLEEAVPWNAVRKNWRSKRANWRRALKQAETVVELSKCLREFRTSLATDSSSVALTAKWSQSIDACIQGLGSHSVLLALWGELKADVSMWLDVRVQHSYLPSVPIHAQAGAVRSIHAMANAAGHCESLLQVPVESILNNNHDSLLAVRSTLERERQLIAAKLAAVRRGELLPQESRSLPSGLLTFNSSPHRALLCMDDFDSGADTGAEEGSEVTDMSDADC